MVWKFFNLGNLVLRLVEWRNGLIEKIAPRELNCNVHRIVQPLQNCGETCGGKKSGNEEKSWGKRQKNWMKKLIDWENYTQSWTGNLHHRALHNDHMCAKSGGKFEATKKEKCDEPSLLLISLIILTSLTIEKGSNKKRGKVWSF